MLIALNALTLLMFVAALPSLGSAQTLSGIAVGQNIETSAELGIEPFATNRSGPFTMSKWQLPGANELSVTAFSDTGLIVYLESNWGGDKGGSYSDFPGFLFGTTTLATIRRTLGSNGFTFSARAAQPLDDGSIAFFNAYETDDPDAIVVVFVTKIAASDIEKIKGHSERLAESATLDTIILSDPMYIGNIWGSERAYDPEYRKITWPTNNKKNVVSDAQINAKALEAAKNSDFATAFAAWKPLAEKGDAEAQFQLAIMYYFGEGVKQDLAEAFRLREAAAMQGHAGAQLDLGVMYSNGEGVTVKKSEAFEWYRKSAEQGNAQAAYNVGLSFENGEGIAQDLSLALEWYLKAAAGGSTEAAYRAGELYVRPPASNRDIIEAFKLFRVAALNNNADSQLAIAKMYLEGQGVPKDIVRAHMWLGYAAGERSGIVSFANGAPGQEAKTLKASIESEMDPTQLEESRILKRNCEKETRIIEALRACGLE